MSGVAQLPRIKKCNVDREIRRLATGTMGRFYILEHTEMRMLERDITRKQVYNVVRSRKLVKGPEWCSKIEDGWLCSYNWITAGVSLTVVVKLVERIEGLCDIVITSFR